MRTILFLVLLVLTACYRQLSPFSPRLVANVLILVDPSSSSGDLKKISITDQRCPEVVAQVHQALSLPKVKHLDVAVYALGDINLTGGEPTAILPWTRFSRTHHLFGKPNSREEQQLDFLKLVDRKCRENLHEAYGSPIVLGLQRSVESLVAHQTELASRQEQVSLQALPLLSDLRDNHHPAVEKYRAVVATALSRGKPLPPRPADLPVIDLRDIKLSLCGLSEHHADSRESALAAQAITLTWNQIVVSKKQPLTFEAACSRESLSLVGLATPKVRP